VRKGFRLKDKRFTSAICSEPDGAGVQMSEAGENQLRLHICLLLSVFFFFLQICYFAIMGNLL